MVGYSTRRGKNGRQLQDLANRGGARLLFFFPQKAVGRSVSTPRRPSVWRVVIVVVREACTAEQEGQLWRAMGIFFATMEGQRDDDGRILGVYSFFPSSFLKKEGGVGATRMGADFANDKLLLIKRLWIKP